MRSSTLKPSTSSSSSCACFPQGFADGIHNLNLQTAFPPHKNVKTLDWSVIVVVVVIENEVLLPSKEFYMRLSTLKSSSSSSCPWSPRGFADGIHNLYAYP